MPITASAPIANGDNTTTTIDLPVQVDKIMATVVFYTSVAGSAATMVAAGTGTRTLTVSRVDPPDPTKETIGTLTMSVPSAALTTQAARAWGYIDLKIKASRLSIVPSAGVNADTSTHFRIIIAS
jgi:hypothetical protein